MVNQVRIEKVFSDSNYPINVFFLQLQDKELLDFGKNLIFISFKKYFVYSGVIYIAVTFHIGLQKLYFNMLLLN